MLNRRILRVKVFQSLYALGQVSAGILQQSKALVATNFEKDLMSEEKYDDEKMQLFTKQGIQLVDKYYESGALPKELTDDFAPEVLAIAQKAIRYYKEELTLQHKIVRSEIASDLNSIYPAYVESLLFLASIVKQVEEEEAEKRKRLLENQPSPEWVLKITKNHYLQFILQWKELQADKLRNFLPDEPQEGFFKNLYRDFIKNDEQYKTYRDSEQVSEEAELTMVRHLLKAILMNFPLSYEHFLNQSINWSENAEIVRAMGVKSLKMMKELAVGDSLTPTSLSLDFPDDLSFAYQLFDETWEKRKAFDADFAEVSNNWDPERFALADQIILKLTLIELMIFPTIPVKVTINEYLDIAKKYSTPGSATFLNGLIAPIAERYQKEGLIKKSGRGMIG